jgi:hypothetical protein
VTFPSASRSGIKIQLTKPLEVESGATTTMVLDFDVGSSFVMRGEIAVAKRVAVQAGREGNDQGGRSGRTVKTDGREELTTHSRLNYSKLRAHSAVERRCEP